MSQPGKDKRGKQEVRRAAISNQYDDIFITDLYRETCEDISMPEKTLTILNLLPFLVPPFF